MDEGKMMVWIEKVLKPYVQDCPVGITPLLYLDSYKCHMMSSFKDRIKNYWEEWMVENGLLEGTSPFQGAITINRSVVS